MFSPCIALVILSHSSLPNTFHKSISVVLILILLGTKSLQIAFPDQLCGQNASENGGGKGEGQGSCLTLGLRQWEPAQRENGEIWAWTLFGGGEGRKEGEPLSLLPTVHVLPLQSYAIGYTHWGVTRPPRNSVFPEKQLSDSLLQNSPCSCTTPVCSKKDKERERFALGVRQEITE